MKILDYRSDSLENPNNNDLSAGFGSSAGVTVNSRTALTYSPFWRGVNLISGDIAKLPCITYERLEGGSGRTPARRHPAYRLLKRRANRNMPAQKFIEAMVFGLVLRGNAYAQIVRDGTGAATELVPMDFNWVQPWLDSTGTLYYEVTIGSTSNSLVSGNPGRNVTIVLPQDRMLHFRGTGADGLAGLDMVHHAGNAIGTGMASDDYAGRFFSNGARPASVLEHPGQLTAEAAERLRESFERMHRGTDNSHRTAILEEGMKLNPFSMTAEESQLTESRKLSIVDAANFLGVPPHKLGSDSRTAFSSLEEENRSYLNESLRPRMVTMQAELELKLLTERQLSAESHFIEFDATALTMPTFEDHVAGLNTLVQAGIATPDEARDRLGMNPQPEGVGDVLYRPLNVEAVGPGADAMEDPQSDSEASDEPTMDESDEAARALLRATLARCVRQLGNAAGRAAGKPEKFVEAVDSMAEKHTERMRDAVDPVAAVVCRGHAGGTIVAAILERFRARMLTAAETTSYDLKRSVSEAVNAAPDEIAAELVQEFR